MNKPGKWPSVGSLLRFVLVMKVSQSRHKNPFSDPSSQTCGCPIKNSGLTPNKFFRFHIEQTEVDPEYRAIMTALKMYFMKTMFATNVKYQRCLIYNASCVNDEKNFTWSDHQPISIGWNSVKPGGNFLHFVSPKGLGILCSGCSDNFHFLFNIKFGKPHRETEPSVYKHTRYSPLGEIFIINIIDSGWKLKLGMKFQIENRELLLTESSNAKDNLQYGYSFKGRHEVNPDSDAVDWKDIKILVRSFIYIYIYIRK